MSSMHRSSRFIAVLYKFRKLMLLIFGITSLGFVAHGTKYVLFDTPIPVYILDKLNLRQFALPDLICDHCNDFNYSYIVENRNACSGEEVFLLTLVTSFHTNVNSRNMMRKTWGGLKEYRGKKLKIIFVFGTHPDKNLNSQTKYEQRKHGDILQANFSDHYRFLTNKTTMALRWATTYCPQAKYILKTDDDSFNIPQNFVDYLIHVKDEKFVGGYCFTVIPDRRPGSKFHVFEDQYPESYYPTYCAGPGYIVSQSAARDIVSVSSNTKYIPMEDVFITGMCRVVAGLQYTEIAGVVVGQDQMTSCNLATWVKNAHNIVPGRAEIIWNQVINLDKTEACATRNVFLYIFLLVFFVLWTKHLFSLHSTSSTTLLRRLVTAPCPLRR